MADQTFECIRPELVKAQTYLARLHFENWLTFITFLRGHFERVGKPRTMAESESSSSDPTKVALIAGIDDGEISHSRPGR